MLQDVLVILLVKLFECTTCLFLTQVCDLENNWWRNRFCSLNSFAPCYLQYFYISVNRESFISS